LFWVLGGLAALVVLFIIWTRLYYDSMWYELHGDEMRWKRGVIFRRTGIVPYNRITNIDIRQGPVMRAFHISTLSIQTAGYSGKAQAEIRIEAIVHAEELRELIRTMVRVSSGGDGTGTGGAVPARVIAPADLQQVLDEMRAIRALLEKKL
jgi:membrane protein YdbS with pleckstrin-like domain